MNQSRTIRSVLSILFALALVCVSASGWILSVSAEADERLTLKINGIEMNVEWEQNASVTALREAASEQTITIHMSMYGGFEQVGPLGRTLPRNDVRITTEPGDLVLYSGNQLVVFYGSNTWAYTRLGHITGKTPAELTDLLGNGNVVIEISLASPAEDDEPCPGSMFSDMPPKDHWAHAAIDWAIVNQITTGTSETTFSPSAGCTRAQVVTFLWRANGSPDASDENLPFTDVSSGAYYEAAVRWALREGITSGTSATSFSPNAVCTRAQIVTFLWRSAGSPEPAGESSSFSDVRAGAYYEKAVRWAAKSGVTAGTSEHTFSPDATCTRAQVVTFLFRAADHNPNS